MDFARVHVGAPAAVTVVAYPGKVFKGEVDWVSGSLDPSTRTAKVRCKFDNPDRLLRPMMYATVQISVDQKMAAGHPARRAAAPGRSRSSSSKLGEGEAW